MKYWFLALALPSMAFAYSPTSQNNCSSLDLRNSTLNEVRNQKDVAWCYAFTGADMLAHAFDETERISAADIAIRYNETKIGLFARWLSVNIINRKDPEYRRTAHQTGFNKIALNKALDAGWCPESILPSEAWTKVIDGREVSVPLAQAMMEISALHDVRRSLNPSNLPFYYKFKNVDAAKFVEMLQTKKVDQFYYNLRNTACREDRRPFKSHPKVKMVIKNPTILRRINEQLENGRLVGLDYDSRVYQEPNRRGFSFAELHTSSLVGRRWNQTKNTCEFLIRNSYGENCQNGRYHSSYDCEDGNLWLTEKQIYQNMTSIVYMLSNG